MGDVEESRQKRRFVEQYEKHKLSPLEELIFKPLEENGLRNLTREEIEKYLSLDIKALKKTKMNMKTIIIAQETQRILSENKQKLLNKIKEREEDEHAREV